MGNHFGYTINGPSAEATELPIRPPKPRAVGKDRKVGDNTLRTSYKQRTSPSDYQVSLSSGDNGFLGMDTPVLPLTPPMLEEEEYLPSADNATPVSELPRTRSMPTTPVNQSGPLTPDNTPPREKPKLRPFLGAQPSMASTRAESFQTAREDLSSDQESISSSPILQASRNYASMRSVSHFTNGTHKPSPLANLPITHLDLSSEHASPVALSHSSVPANDDGDQLLGHADVGASSVDNLHVTLPQADTISNTPVEVPYHVEVTTHRTIQSQEGDVRRGRSLRERLEASQQVSRSPSMDKFASIIGWSHDVRGSDVGRRMSGMSNTSTVEAFLIESPRIPKKRYTLRHVSKNESLRSASSPLPTSNRDSMQSTSDSPHRLLHKKAKIGNHNRLSFGSEMSHTLEVGPNVVSKIEVIKVAVIPARSSSLQQSRTSSRRHSLSTTGAPSSFRKPHSPTDTHRKRALTETTERSRERYYPPQVPPRRSSLSAPSSRNTSRANSISADPVRFERKRAEKDLRTTLDRMELERLVSSPNSGSIDLTPTTVKASQTPGNEHSHEESVDEAREQYSTTNMGPDLARVTPVPNDWADFRRPSMLHTPHSQPSFMSASPEISEAKLISFHVHNNHSVQLIEPFPLSESYAVEEARRLAHVKYQETNALDPSLREPQQASTLPQVHIVPATPQMEMQVQLGDSVQPSSAPSVPTTPQRPAVRPRADSFAKTLLRSVSLKHARNKKADQELDSSQNPFWRPRPFWDGIEGISPEKKGTIDHTDRGIVNNSLGLPQQRLVVPGPLALVRKLSERRRNGKLIARQSSYNSLHRLRTGRRLHRLPGLGMPLQFMSFKDMAESIHVARQKRADEKRERRREALRKSIGSNIVATGDSRFPATAIGEDLER